MRVFEKVNPSHPDKIADRIAGAIVDKCYKLESFPKVAVEVLLGHGEVMVIAETSTQLTTDDVSQIVERLLGECKVRILIVPQDEHLADNQSVTVRCGDNGIFKGLPVSEEQKILSRVARKIYERKPFDGKYIWSPDGCAICQSNAEEKELVDILDELENDYVFNPLGGWTGGWNVDSGATNRKLGSDMGEAVTGGGLHGKDLSKADVTLNIYAHLRAQELEQEVELSCAIGDEFVDGKSYGELVEIAKKYIDDIGGFEKFAEWGLI